MAKAKQSATSARTPKPYVWVFQLGKNAKVGKKRVPAAYTASCCYFYRQEHDKYTKVLEKIDEAEVPEADSDLTFAAIDEFVDRCELKPEVYTDVEIEADEECAENRGFHTSASFEEAKAALAKGGFTVVRMIDPLAIPEVKLSPAEKLEEAVAELERRLDLTTLDLVLARIDGELTRHASGADYLITYAFEPNAPKGLVERISAGARHLHPELRDTLLVLVGHHARKNPEIATLLATLPLPTDARVKKLLASWGVTAGTAPAMKAEAPVAAKEPAKPNGKSTQAKPGIEAKIAKIEALAKKAGVTLSGGATEEAIAKLEKALGVKLPAEVRAFYLAHDGGPPNTGVFSGRALLSLKGILTYWKVWKKAFDDGEMDEDTEPDEGIQQEWWVPQWIPVTSDFGGNHDMIDLAPDEGGKVGQIIAVWHDDTSRTIEGDSFLDWLAEQTWGEGE